MTDSEKLDTILEKIIDIEKRVKSLEIALENGTDKNIHLILDGHLALDINLSKADTTD